MGKKKIAAGGGFEGRTYESLLMAARAAKTPEQKRSVLIQLNQVTANLTQKDIATWRTAWQMAINVENPKRSKLYDCYTDALIDLHLTGCMGQRDGKTLQKKFVLRTRDGKEDVEAKKMFERQWFADFVEYVLESRYWGHTLIQMGDVATVNGVRTFTDVSVVPAQARDSGVRGHRQGCGRRPPAGRELPDGALFEVVRRGRETPRPRAAAQVRPAGVLEEEHAGILGCIR